MDYYLHLEFKSASLITPPLRGGQSKDKHIVRDQTYVGDKFAQIDSPRIDDFAHPIKLSQLSNMLHVMCNLPPVPSKRKSIFKVNEKVHEAAKNSWIKYDNLFLNENGIPLHAEIFQSAKSLSDSHLKIKTEFKDFTASGHFNWEFLRRHLIDETELYNDLLTLFNTVLKCDNVISKYTFVECINIFSLKIKDDVVIDFIKERNEFYQEKCKKTFKDVLLTPWYNVIFEAKNGDLNTRYSSKTPLLNIRGIKYKIVYDGEIIIKISDEDVVNQIREYGRIPTILDGGVITILGFSKRPPSSDFEKVFERIF